MGGFYVMVVVGVVAAVDIGAGANVIVGAEDVAVLVGAGDPEIPESDWFKRYHQITIIVTVITPSNIFMFIAYSTVYFVRVRYPRQYPSKKAQLLVQELFQQSYYVFLSSRGYLLCLQKMKPSCPDM